MVAELPLGATEDRVSGTIDFERALKDSVKAFAPGLLARANRGFLYIDEVNLLEDHLVDLLLDVAMTGWNRVEREGISIEHPARFVLIGSGNPEEGELRPQLLDRFGLHAEVKTENNLDQRVQIVERREAFDREPNVFRQSFAVEQRQLRNKITRAHKLFANVKLEQSLLYTIAQLCWELKVDGHRGELTIMRAARALAAFDGRKNVTEDDVKTVAVMSLRHRLRRDTLEETGGSNRIKQALEKVFTNAPDSEGRGERQENNWSADDGQNENGHEGKGAKGNNAHSPRLTGDQATTTTEIPSLEDESSTMPFPTNPRRARATDKPQLRSRQATGMKSASINPRPWMRRCVRYWSYGLRILPLPQPNRSAA